MPSVVEVVHEADVVVDVVVDVFVEVAAVSAAVVVVARFQKNCYVAAG